MIDSGPFELLLVALTGVAWARGQAIYWLARGTVTQARRRTERLHQWLELPVIGRAQAWLDRFGWPLISLAYLTVGLQSAIMAAAGLVQMQWWRFSLAQLPGSVAWGFIYATVGFAAWQAMWVGAVDSWQIWVGVGAGAVALIAWWLARR